jgi:5'-methylthioadenosine phosphorylase
MSGDTIPTGFITGTGFYELPGSQKLDKKVVETPFGIVEIDIVDFFGQKIAFIPRHGKKHTIPPRDINHRANIYSLKSLGVQRILATSVSGSLNPEWGPGTFLLLAQFLNFSYGRPDSFYPLDGKLAHVDVTDPYCLTLRGQLKSAAESIHFPLQDGATYACFNGPRYETRAEIEMVKRAGGHLVGHTNYPEMVLAREMEICYASVGIVSNYAAGFNAHVTSVEVTEALANLKDKMTALFSAFLQKYPAVVDCSCQHVLKDSYL